MINPSSALIRLRQLHALTPARIGLARAGSSISTADLLKFDRDHARARDAVHLPFNMEEVVQKLQAREIHYVQVQSAAADRSTYLRRPDLGRQLNEASKHSLTEYVPSDNRAYDLGIVIADGLSPGAIHINAISFLDEFLSLPRVKGWKCSPVVIASQARVAIADEICEILNTRLSIILIGERPGLSAANSMGIYVTFAPQNGRTDAERNCISNVHPGGLNPQEAARKLESLISASFRQCLSGVLLKGQ